MKRYRQWPKSDQHGYALWLINDLMEELNIGNITAEEVLFLTRIHNLAMYGNNSHPKWGCYIGNKRLGVYEGISQSSARQLLYRLQKQGYLKFKSHNGVRYIRTLWHKAERRKLDQRKPAKS